MCVVVGMRFISLLFQNGNKSAEHTFIAALAAILMENIQYCYMYLRCKPWWRRCLTRKIRKISIFICVICHSEWTLSSIRFIWTVHAMHEWGRTLRIFLLFCCGLSIFSREELIAYVRPVDIQPWQIFAEHSRFPCILISLLMKFKRHTHSTIIKTFHVIT